MNKNNAKNKKLAAIATQKNQKRQHNTQFYYSFLTIILLICLVQISISAILNISKIIAYRQKLGVITKTEKEAENKNIQLKDDIKKYSLNATLESIARENLKMASKDEVMIIVNKKKEIIPKRKLKHKKEKKQNETIND